MATSQTHTAVLQKHTRKTVGLNVRAINPERLIGRFGRWSIQYFTVLPGYLVTMLETICTRKLIGFAA
jgi:hypothetical protein